MGWLGQNRSSSGVSWRARSWLRYLSRHSVTHGLLLLRLLPLLLLMLLRLRLIIL